MIIVLAVDALDDVEEVRAHENPHGVVPHTVAAENAEQDVQIKRHIADNKLIKADFFLRCERLLIA